MWIADRTTRCRTWCSETVKPRVAFLYPPFGPVLNEPNLRVVKANYGVFPNLSLLYAAASFRAAGAEVMLVDAAAESLNPAGAIARLRAFGPDVVGFTMTTYLFHQSLAWIRCVKQALGVRTLVGGLHLSQYPAETMTHPEIDFALQGEAELTAGAFVAALRTDKDLEQVPGLWWREDGRIRHNHEPGLLEDVDAAPLPARDLIDNSRYYSFISQRRNFTPLITGRGCPFRCTFCEQGTVRYRGRSAASVADELEFCIDRHGVRELAFFDSSFTADRSRTLKLCREIDRRGIRVVWAARSRVDSMDESLLAALAEAGCRRIYYGIESGDAELRAALGKPIDEEQLFATLSATRRAGIETFGYFIIGVPGETAATAEATARLARRLPLDFAQFSRLTPMPGTAIYARLLDELGEDPWRDTVLDERNEALIPRPDTSLTDEQVTRWCRTCYREFYYRPGHLLRAVRRLRSLDEGWRGARAALQMAVGGGA